WDVQSGEQLVLIEPRSGFVRTVAYSPLGDTVALGVWDSTNAGTIRIYDAATGEEVQRFFSHTVPPNDVVYSPDGTRVISVAWDRFVKINDLQRGVEVASYTGFGDRLLAVDISQDGQFLLVAQGNIGDNEFQEDETVQPNVWLWDLQSRDQVAVLSDHQDWVWAVDFSADNSLMATGTGPFRLPETAADGSTPAIDAAVRVYDVRTHELLHTLEGHRWVVDSVRFHPDGETIFSGSWDGLIIRWNLETGEQVQTYEGHEGHVNMIRLNEDGSRLYSAGGDGKVIVWDTETGEQLTSFEHESSVVSVALSPDESQLVTGSGNNVIIWDLASGERVQTLVGHTGSVNEAIFHPDGKRVFSTSWDATVRLWDVASGEQIGEYTGHNDTTWGLAVTSDGSLLLTTSSDQTVRLWDVETAEELHRYEEHTNWVLEVVLSPDETMLLSAAEDNTARLWRLDRNLDQLLAFVGQDRYVRELSCAEREVYRVATCEVAAEATEAP
ncbi:MAG: PQQ-binding-like beta-propeller repeat protein, partial [Anaerolineae bacterium]|nr:PQQ-binding-like beta-propeller repeat protein [Anaerolineae bacterium]